MGNRPERKAGKNLPPGEAIAGPTTFHLVRHGETYADQLGWMPGRHESALTSKGRYAASCLSVKLGGIPFAAVYASPSAGASSTAGILVAGRGLPVHADPALDEIDLAGWAGRPSTEIAREEPLRYADFRERPDREPAGGESFAQAGERMSGFLSNLSVTHAGKHVLVVSHSLALKALLAAWEGAPPAAIRDFPEPRPCSHAVWRANADGRPLPAAAAPSLARAG